MGRVGYAPTTPAMSMQYSTIELTARSEIQIFISFFEKIFVSLFTAYIIEKFIINKVILKLLKKEPLGNNGTKLINKNKAASLNKISTIDYFSNYSKHKIENY